MKNNLFNLISNKRRYWKTLVFCVWAAVFAVGTVSAQVSINTATAWWNNESFESQDNALLYLNWTLGGGASQPIFGSSPAATSSASGYFFATQNSNQSQPRTINKTMPTLSKFVYIKTAFGHMTYGATYSFRDTNGARVFEIGSENSNAGPDVCFTNISSATVGLGKRGDWSDVELILDLQNNKIMKLTAQNSSLTKKTFTTSDVSLSTTHNGTISQFYIIGRSSNNGLDNTTIAELIPDKIKLLSGAAELQTLAATEVNEIYSVTSFTTAMGLDIDIPAGVTSNIQWEISDYAGLSSSDVSITRSTSDYAQAVLKTTDAVSTDVVITIKASFGSTQITQDVTLKAASLSALKASLLDEINTATDLHNTAYDNNGYITTLLSDLNNAINTAQAIYDNTGVTNPADIAIAISNLQTAETDFNSALLIYTTYVAYIATVQAAYDAEVRTTAFFTAIKITLLNAIGTANTAKGTVASSSDITTAKSALEQALADFTDAIPHYTDLETSIADAQSKLTAAQARIGTEFLNFPQADYDIYSTAVASAGNILATATTTAALDAAKTAVESAYTTLYSARIAPLTTAYRIYSYGVDEGDISSDKKVLYADGSTLKYTTATSHTADKWVITEVSPDVYTVQNLVTNTYIGTPNGDSPVTLSSTPINLTISEGMTNTNFVLSGSKIFADTGYFLYSILNGTKSLEIDATDALILKNAYAIRGRYCFQFEPVPATTWTGASATWDEESNWSNGVPDQTSQVIIPASVIAEFPASPTNTTVKSITFEQDAGADLAGTFYVTDSLYVKYTITGEKWYAIGFPFTVNKVHSHYFENQGWDAALYPHTTTVNNDYYLRNYTATSGFTPVSTFETDAYIAYFPSCHNGEKISFISEGPLDLSVASSTLPAASAEYKLEKNPTFNKILLSAAADTYYYVLNSAGTSFDLVENDTYLNAFESVITILKSSVSSAPAHIEITDTPTGISFHEAGEPVIATRYYNLQGVEISVHAASLQSGVFIKKTVYQSGAVSVSKIIEK